MPRWMRGAPSTVPAISAVVAAALARLPAGRKVTGLTIVPNVMRWVSRASPASVTHASVDGRPSRPATLV